MARESINIDWVQALGERSGSPEYQFGNGPFAVLAPKQDNVWVLDTHSRHCFIVGPNGDVWNGPTYVVRQNHIWDHLCDAVWVEDDLYISWASGIISCERFYAHSATWWRPSAPAYRIRSSGNKSLYLHARSESHILHEYTCEGRKMRSFLPTKGSASCLQRLANHACFDVSPAGVVYIAFPWNRNMLFAMPIGRAADFGRVRSNADHHGWESRTTSSDVRSSIVDRLESLSQELFCPIAEEKYKMPSAIPVDWIADVAWDAKRNSVCVLGRRIVESVIIWIGQNGADIISHKIPGSWDRVYPMVDGAFVLYKWRESDGKAVIARAVVK